MFLLLQLIFRSESAAGPFTETCSESFEDESRGSEENQLSGFCRSTVLYYHLWPNSTVRVSIEEQSSNFVISFLPFFQSGLSQ